MILHIHTLFEDSAESRLCRDFLVWQGHTAEIKPHTATTFKAAHGTDRPAVFHNDALMACGFVQLVQHFDQHALLNAA